MAMEQEQYNQFIEKMNITLNQLKKQNYQEFLKSLHFNTHFLFVVEKHKKTPFSGPFIYPQINPLNNRLLDVLNVASFEQQIVLFPLLLDVFKTFHRKVREFTDFEPTDDFSEHLKAMDTNVQALLDAEPVKNLQQKLDNLGLNLHLIKIIQQLKANISGQKNQRETVWYSQWKIDLFTQIENKLSNTVSLTDSEWSQYVADIREVCGKRRNSWHFWSEPHSVAEFDALLAGSSLSDTTSHTTSESDTTSDSPGI